MNDSKTEGWLSGVAINLLSNLIGLAVGAVATYFSHAGSIWVKPILFGGLAWLITFATILGWRAMNLLPPKVDSTTVVNIETKARRWLDRYSFSVQTLREPSAYFCLVGTTETGRKITVTREIGAFSDSVLVSAYWNAGQDERQRIEKLDESQRNELRYLVFVELSRAVIGYTSPDIFSCRMLLRVPINSSLNETAFIDAVWKIEAALNTLTLMGGHYLSKIESRQESKARH